MTGEREGMSGAAMLVLAQQMYRLRYAGWSKRRRMIRHGPLRVVRFAVSDWRRRGARRARRSSVRSRTDGRL